MNLVFCDIETDGLDATTIWCAVCRHNGVIEVICNEKDFKNYVSDVKTAGSFSTTELALMFLWLSVFGTLLLTGLVVTDTLILSRLADPSRSGGHSLRNWGNILGFAKGRPR